MKQGDLFEETLEKKIHRMERRIIHVQKELWFLKEIYSLSQTNPPKQSQSYGKIEQLDIFSR